MRNLFLTGFMGTGKTTIGKLVADRLKFQFIDMDDEIERRSQKNISQIFSEDGEAAFRKMESRLLEELMEVEHLVVATGGGTLVNPENRKKVTGDEDICVICLNASSEEITKRVKSDNRRERPLLTVDRPEEKIDALLKQRQPAYSEIPWQVNTDNLSIGEVVEKILTISNFKKLIVHHTEGQYPIWIGAGTTDVVANSLHAMGVTPMSRVGIVTNETIAPLYLEKIKTTLENAGYGVSPIILPDGEQHKRISNIETIYHALIRAEFDRSDTLLALGGGVIGDMTGFAAATYMRGIRFVQVPTTLLAMVDASVGGKTGVDLIEGKNLVGAFKQPAAVYIDPGVLHTLPLDELRSGMAELIKHGIIADEILFQQLKQLKGDYSLFWESSTGAELIQRSLLVKTAIVEQDPFERNIRAVLNLGHTTGHALETISNFELKHGEGVGIGMLVACDIAWRKGLIDQTEIRKIADLLETWKLQTRIPRGMQVEKIMMMMTRDKKKAGKKIKWVLPVRVGHVILDDQVETELIREALIHLGAE